MYMYMYCHYCYFVNIYVWKESQPNSNKHLGWAEMVFIDIGKNSHHGYW